MPNPIKLCPHCEQGISSGAYRRHVRGCKRRPPDEVFFYARQGGCDDCSFVAACARLEQDRERVLCEAPDETDLANEAARNGRQSVPEPTWNGEGVLAGVLDRVFSGIEQHEGTWL